MRAVSVIVLFVLLVSLARHTMANEIATMVLDRIPSVSESESALVGVLRNVVGMSYKEDHPWSVGQRDVRILHIHIIAERGKSEM